MPPRRQPGHLLRSDGDSERRLLKIERLLEQLTRRVGSALAPVAASPVQLSVGAGGDYRTLNAALADISRRHPTYTYDGQTIELVLLSGFVQEEQVFVRDLDLGWVTITSEDAVVSVARDALVDQVATLEYPAWLAENATLPTIGCMFEMDTSGPMLEQNGVMLRKVSKACFLPGSGFQGAAHRNIDVHQASRLSATEADFSNSLTIGVRVGNGSIATLRYCAISGCGNDNVAVGGASLAILADTDLTNGGRNGLSVSGNSRVSAATADCSGAAEDCISAQYGGLIQATDGALAMNAGHDGVVASSGATIIADGVDASNADRYGFYALNGATIQASGTTADNCAYGYYAIGASIINAPGSQGVGCASRAVKAYEASTINVPDFDGTGSGDVGVEAEEGSTINAHSADFSGATNYGILALSSSRICATFANGQRGGAPSPTDIAVGAGSHINAGGATGGLNHPKNTLTEDGVIFQP